MHFWTQKGDVYEWGELRTTYDARDCVGMEDHTIPASAADMNCNTLDIDLFGNGLPGTEFEAALASASTMRNDKDVIRDLKLKWLFDSGAGLDIVSMTCLVGYMHFMYESKHPINFWTANGKTLAKYQINIYVEAFDEIISPYVLKDTPNLLSMGRRAQCHGWGVKWEPRQPGCTVTIPDKGELFLHSESFIPTVNENVEQRKPQIRYTHSDRCGTKRTTDARRRCGRICPKYVKYRWGRV